MTIRTDVKFEPELSPRLITLDNTSNSITMQDLHDTSTNWEDELHLGMAFNQLIKSAGKEDLGGGVLVGITSTLQNAQLEFEPRTTPLSNGTATAIGTTILTDGSGTFQTDLVSRGDIIINFTDFSMATVLSVTSETSLIHRVLTGGTNDDWSISDVYRIYDVEQVEIAGGNLVAIDAVEAVLSAILPSFGTQIVRTSSSSSTITEIEANTYLSGGGIHIDVVNGFSGTTFPTGTPTRKSNNLADAIIIGSNHGISIFIAHSALTLNQDFKNSTMKAGISLPTINVNGFDVDGSTFEFITLTGTMTGFIRTLSCLINNCNGISGFIQNSGFQGTNTIGGTLGMAASSCFTVFLGSGTPIFDLSAGFDMRLVNYSGSFIIRNVSTPGQIITTDINTGEIELQNTCTDGSITVRGLGEKPIDNSAGSNVTLIGFISGNTVDSIDKNTKLIPALV